MASRRLIYSHEFAGDRDRDPVWPRLERVFGFYQTRDYLAVATERGHSRGRSPESTHCNNVGAIHRREFYPHFQTWFEMRSPVGEFQHRRENGELVCLIPEAADKLDPQTVHKLAGQLADDRISASRKVASIGNLGYEVRRQQLRDGWSRLLGRVSPPAEPVIKAATREEMSLGDKSFSTTHLPAIQPPTRF